MLSELDLIVLFILFNIILDNVVEKYVFIKYFFFFVEDKVVVDLWGKNVVILFLVVLDYI